MATVSNVSQNQSLPQAKQPEVDMMIVPAIRILDSNANPVRKNGDYVLYWMIANRRLTYNYSLQRTVEWATKLGKPILILEALNVDYEWASVRIHRFVVQGMADHREAAAKAKVSYLPYVEPQKGAGSGMLKALADKACVVVTDDFPCFFLPQMVKAAAAKINIKMEAVDSNGIYPLRDTDRVFTKAFSFRNHLQKTITPYLTELPVRNPLATKKLVKQDCIPKTILKKWPAATDTILKATSESFVDLPIDQSIGPAVIDGGPIAAKQTCRDFLKHKLHRYADDRNQPDTDPSSGLSAYLHFGHISSHDVFAQLVADEEWTVDQLNDVKQTKGSRQGWWNMSAAAEAFLDQLITWREIGYNMCAWTNDFDQFQSLPDFAQKTLREHATDLRPYVYSYEQFRDSKTHDDIWNAAQNQLVTEGRMHNYLRMLWGKKILEWSPTPQDAIETMIDLNNRYAVDGRNPNSYSGIFWVLGRYDRAWGPEREIFGKIRFMSSDSTRRKLKLKAYLKQFGVRQTNRLF